MAEKVENQTAGKKVNSFLERNKKLFIIVGIVLVVLLVGFVVAYGVGKSTKTKDIAKLDAITFTLVDDSMADDAAALEARRNAGLEDLQDLVGKSGIVGARANMLAAELCYQLEKYDDAINYWEVTAKKAGKSYIAPIANFNLGACYEEVGKVAEASEYYKLAADDENFVLNTHAKFSYGRTLEAQNLYTEAVAAYKELNDKNPDDSWAKLGKSRIIALQAEGKAE